MLEKYNLLTELSPERGVNAALETLNDSYRQLSRQNPMLLNKYWQDEGIFHAIGRANLDRKNTYDLAQVRKSSLSQERNEFSNYFALLSCERIDLRVSSSFFCQNLVRAIHLEYSKGLLPEESAGHWRKTQIFIKGGRAGSENPEAKPLPEDIEGLVKEIENWLEKQKALPLPVQVFLAQYFYLKIHPFKDFNGRTLRMIARSELMSVMPFVRFCALELNLPTIRRAENILLDGSATNLKLTNFVSLKLLSLSESMKEVSKHVDSRMVA